MNKYNKAILCLLFSTSLLNVTTALSSNSVLSEIDSSEAGDSPRGTPHDNREFIFTDQGRRHALLINPDIAYQGEGVRSKITDTNWQALAKIESMDLTLYPTSWVVEHVASLLDLLATAQKVYISNPFNTALPEDFDILLPGLSLDNSKETKVICFNALGPKSLSRHISLFLQFSQNLSPMTCPVFFNALRKRVQVNSLIDLNPDKRDLAPGASEKKPKTIAEQLIPFGIILEERQQPYKLYEKEAAWIWLEKTTDLFYKETKNKEDANDGHKHKKGSGLLLKHVSKSNPQKDEDKAMTDFNEKIALLSATLLIPAIKIDLVIKDFKLTFGNSLRNLDRISWVKYLSSQDGETLLSIADMSDEIRKKIDHGLSWQARKEVLEELLKSTPRTRKKIVEKSVKASGSRKFSWRKSMEQKQAAIDKEKLEVSRSRSNSFTIPGKDELLIIARRQSTGTISIAQMQNDCVNVKK